MKKRQSVADRPPLIEFTSREVAYSREPILTLRRDKIAFLKGLATDSPRGRARICAHHAPGDPVHEMLIAVEKRSYLRPHRHLNKSESFHMIEGAMDIVIFADDGAITDVIPMSTYDGEGCFFYRLGEPRFHTLLLRSDWVLFHETTKGPFDPSATIVAPWAPHEESSEHDIKIFNARIEEAVRAHRAGA